MPRRKRPGEWAVLYAEIPPALKERLESQAIKNNRSTVGELIELLNKHLDQLPDHKAERPRPATKGKK